MAAAGGMGTLQALLTELSGLKKPRGFVNRYVRRIFGMRPKPPPKYRILVMMATNMPSALDEALLRPGRIDRIYKVGYPSKGRPDPHLRGILLQGSERADRGAARQTGHDHPVRDRRHHQGPGQRGAHHRDQERPRRHHLAGRDQGQAAQELGPPEDVEYIERERHAVAVHEACHALVAFRTRQHMEIDIATIEKGSDYPRHGGEHPARGTSSPGGAASTRPTSWCRWPRWPAERMFFEQDSSSGVSGDLESATAVALVHGGLLGHGHHGVLLLHGQAARGRLAGRRPGRRA